MHDRHAGTVRPRLAGWWGTKEETKFEMDLVFSPIEGANGYRMSNPCVLAVVALKASLDIFDKTDMKALVARSRGLTGYLEYLIDALIPTSDLVIITPRDVNQRGCQLSFLFPKPGMMTKVFAHLKAKGIVCDERKPDVIRIAPAPLYNTFLDVWTVVKAIQEMIE